MKRLIALLPWLATALVAAVAALNWTTLTALAPIDLALTQVQLPLGVMLLGVSAALAALFFVAYLQNQISTLIETRKLLKEAQRAHDLADKAEASRIDGLKTLVTGEFERLHRRIDELGHVVPHVAPLPDPVGSDEPVEFRPRSLTDLVTGRNH